MKKLIFSLLLSISIIAPSHGFDLPIDSLCKINWSKSISAFPWSDFGKTVGFDAAKKSIIVCSLIFAYTQLLPNLAKKIEKTKYPKAFNFIQQELEKSGVNPHDVIIRGTSPYSWATTSNLFETYLFVPESDLIEIENMLTEHPDSTLLNRYRFVINHEANHMRCKHVHKRMIPLMGTIAASIALGKALMYLVQYNSNIINGGKGENLSPLETLLVNYSVRTITTMCSMLVISYFSRSQEQEADDLTNNDLAVLKGGVKYFEEVKKITDHIADSNIRDALSTHPRLSDRIDRLKDRIEILEAASTQSTPAI